MKKWMIGAAQMGPIQKSESRKDVVQRMMSLLESASDKECDLVVFPELALTTFFPRWYFENQKEVDFWFEKEMPNNVTVPLFQRSRDLGIAISFGYAELTPEGDYFNTSILTNRRGEIIGKYRKTHLPGHDKFDPNRIFQHLEKRYFAPGDTGFKTFDNEGTIMGMCICNDRRWPETWRVMGLQGVELVMLGYNTPSSNSQNQGENIETRLYHSELSVTAGAYQNSTWAVAVAKAGIEDGHHLIGGSIIVDPNGFVVSRAKTEGDELITAECDVKLCEFGKKTVFDFSRHRRIEHYSLISRQAGVSRKSG